MSYELIGIILLGLLLGTGQIISIVISIRGFQEMSRIQRAIAGLIVQESEKVQALLREASG
ncbi:MAG: hypothetical protein HY347_03060 [candidate division NC10 bacterium]|nr:hypothetical protein [candidate division NC10 bacterium]